MYVTGEIISEMFRRTDENGILLMPAWRTEEDKPGLRFFKCRMDPECEEETLDGAWSLGETLAAIEDYYESTGADFGSRPANESELEDLSCFRPEQVLEAFDAWDRFLLDNGITSDEETEQICRELFFDKGQALDLFKLVLYIKSREFFATVGANIPKPDWSSRYLFAQLYTLTEACSEIECVDLMTDSYDHETGSLGSLDKNDICIIQGILDTECYLLPRSDIGYTLLLNHIFGEARLDIVRYYDELKPAIDKALDTLFESEKNILEKLYDLSDGKRRSIYELARDTQSIPCSIKFTQAKAMRKLRHPARSRVLKSFFDK